MDDNKELFETAPVPKAVIALVVPTVISQLITVIYNMADTFFIGQIGDPDQVAAVAICMPIFILLTGMANLFGIGGAGLISRCLGGGERAKAKNVSAFCVWTAGGLAFVYGLAIYAGQALLLPAIGADGDTYGFCCRYAFWAITVGAVPTVLNAVFAHLVRAEGYSKQASFGMAMGGVLNMILDPVFISLFGLEIAGAAIATMLSNGIAAGYFVVLILRRGQSTVLTLHPRHYTLRMRIPAEVLLTGLPSFTMNITGVVSNVCINRLMASYCNEAVAGIGIAKKVDMLSYSVATGMSQGVIPLIGYNYSAKNYRRMMAAVKTAFAYSIGVATVSTVFLLTCARPIVRAFIDDPLTVEYGQRFQRIICLTGPCIAVAMIIITMFQSVGKKAAPLVLSLLRKGGLDIPAMFVMDRLVGVNGIAWATPIADFLAMLAAICVFIPFWKNLKRELSGAAQAE